MRKMLGITFVSAATLASAQTGTSDLLAPGAWEENFTMQVTKINGEPAPVTPPYISLETDCYTDQDVADPKKLLLAGAEQTCSVSDFSMTGGKLSMSASCTVAPGLTFNGDLQGSYSSDAFDLSGIMRSEGPMPSEASASMSARRVGVCPQ